MNRKLQYLNLLGILAMVVLCAIQWRTNRRLHLTTNDLEQTRLNQLKQIEERDRAIQGYTADLNEFRERLSLSEAQLKSLNVKLNTALHERDQMKADNASLQKQRAELTASIGQWTAAVAERDATIKSAAAQATAMIAERNQAISRFNDLADKYNTLVKNWNRVQTSRATTRNTETQ